MKTIEIHSVPTTDDIEVRQDEFVKNRISMFEAERDISNPNLSQEERDKAKSKVIQFAMKNDDAFRSDPRVVDKAIQKDWGPHQH